MLKIILFVFIVLFVVLCFTLSIKVDYEKDAKKYKDYDKDTFEAEISALEDKVFHYKKKAEQGVDQAKEKLDRYTKELEEIKQFQNKLKNHE